MEFDINNILNRIKISLTKNDFDECYETSVSFLKKLTQEVKSNPSNDEYKNIYDLLISIVKEGSIFLPKWHLEECSAIQLDLLTVHLKCIRNSFYNNSQGQLYVSKNDELRNCLLSVLHHLFSPAIIDERLNCKASSADDDRELKLQSHTEASKACVTCFINMMVGVPSVRNTLWPHIRHEIQFLLQYPEPGVAQVSAALIHQFLLENSLRDEILNEHDSLVSDMLNIYAWEGPDACFALFCLNIILSSHDGVSRCWAQLSTKQCLLCLDILASFVDKKTCKVELETLDFLQNVFKKEADYIFSSHEHRKSTIDSHVFYRLLGFLCLVGASDLYQEHLQNDKSLLVTTLFLLKSLIVADKTGNRTNRETVPPSEISDADELSQQPTVGFKRDLIRLLACLVYKNKENQDVVGDMDGVLLLLESSQYDERNPLIKETCIFALRNLLENNDNNQKIVANLNLRGVADNPTLEKLGLTAEILEGKVVLNQIY